MTAMQVVLFRHGIAEDREAFAATGAPDSERPLTGRGARRTARAAEGLLSLLGGVEMIAASPLVRARQTADIVARACEQAGHAPERATLDALSPGGSAMEVLGLLAVRPRNETIVLVGHEPDLSGLLAGLTTGGPDGFARFKKAGACLVEMASPPAPGGGELQWLLQPAVLRRLAGD